MAAAAATLSDSAPGAIRGMVTVPVQSERTGAEMPCPSFPKTKTVEFDRGSSAKGVPAMSVAHKETESSDLHPVNRSVRGSRPTGIRAKDPMDACTTLGW
jgi:hypothetical protein